MLPMREPFFYCGTLHVAKKQFDTMEYYYIAINLKV